MLKLVSKKGRWAKLDNSMIFSNVIYLVDEKDAWTYHLVDDEKNNMPLEGRVTDYIVDDSEEESPMST